MSVFAHGDAYVGGSQCLSVVDSVAYHCHVMSFRLQLSYHVFFILRHNAALPMDYSGFVGPIFGCFLLVAAHHIHLYALVMKHLHGLASSGL